MIRATCKIWLSKNKEKVFGQGPCRLLRGVEKTNSLHQAAHEMGMSYNKAWRLIRLMEERLGFLFLDKQVGGHCGGGSKVTPGARDFIERYERFEMDAMRAVEKAYRKHFGDRPGKRGWR